MKSLKYTITLLSAIFIFACGESKSTDEHGHDHEEHSDHEGHDDHVEQIHLTNQQFNTLNFKIDSLPMRNISTYVDANGVLEVPPQNEAEITAIIGANIKSIEVIEGQKVKKGQVIAYLNHPDLIQIQTNYITSWNEQNYLEIEFDRQKKLYEEKVGSGKDFQKIKSEFQIKKAEVSGLEAQLNLLGISTSALQENKITQNVPVRSPISGYVRKVEVKIGQFVGQESPMFEIVNVEHVHADLMVFEKDVHKVKEGQKVMFMVESLPGKELFAEIYSVGKNFEQDPKAVHLHAEIENKEGLLIPGMYVRGRIFIDDVQSFALPEEGVVRDGDKYFIYSAKRSGDEWTFIPIEVLVGERDNGWIEIKLLKDLKPGAKIAWNNAYNLLAEMKKGETEHSH